MGIPGNQFWKLRSKHGRDKLFATPDLMWQAACEYFQWCIDNPFIEVEQNKSRPYKDGKKWIIPEPLAQLPKMRPFTLHGLCLYMDANTVYFNQFEASLKDKTDQLSLDFSKVVTRIRETIYSQQFSGAASGFLNPNIIARSLGLVEKSEQVNPSTLVIKVETEEQKKKIESI